MTLTVGGTLNTNTTTTISKISRVCTVFKKSIKNFEKKNSNALDALIRSNVVIETMVILIMFDIRNIGCHATGHQVIPKQVSAFVFSKPRRQVFSRGGPIM